MKERKEMPFGAKYKQESSSSNKTNIVRESAFMTFSPGERVVRILTEEIIYWRYYMHVTVNGTTVQRPVIVGSFDNPIKRYMDSLGEGHPQYRKVSKRYATNVLDRTVAKITPSGQVVYANENGSFPSNDPATGKSIVDISPTQVNRLRILEFGGDLMSSLEPIATRTISRETGDRMSPHDFDIRIIVSGTGRQQRKQPMADINTDEIHVDEVYDLETIFKPLPDQVLARIIEPNIDYVEVLREAGYLHNYPKIPYHKPVVVEPQNVEQPDEDSLF